jgi:hypothetical protein
MAKPKSIASSNNFLTIDAKNGALKFNGESLADNNGKSGVQATITEIKAKFDHGRDTGAKTEKIEAGPTAEITLRYFDEDGAEDEMIFTIPARHFTGLKFISLLGSLETPYITLSIQPNGDFSDVFVGYREEETATKTKFCKQACKIDWKAGQLIDADGEPVEPREVFAALAERLKVPFEDNTEADRAEYDEKLQAAGTAKKKK